MSNNRNRIGDVSLIDYTPEKIGLNYGTENAKLTQGVGQELMQYGMQQSERIYNASRESFIVELKSKIDSEFSNIENNYINSGLPPADVEKRFDTFSQNFFGQIKDAEINTMLQGHFQSGRVKLERLANKKHLAVLDSNLETQLRQEAENLTSEAQNIAIQMHDSDDIIREDAVEKYATNYSRMEEISGVLKSDGSPMFTPLQRKNMITAFEKGIKADYMRSWVINQEDQLQAILALANYADTGKMSEALENLDIPIHKQIDEKGNTQQWDLTDMLSPSEARRFAVQLLQEKTINDQIQEKQKLDAYLQLEQQRNDYGLSIQQAVTDPQGTKNYNDMLQDLENNYELFASDNDGIQQFQRLQKILINNQNTVNENAANDAKRKFELRIYDKKLTDEQREELAKEIDESNLNDIEKHKLEQKNLEIQNMKYRGSKDPQARAKTNIREDLMLTISNIHNDPNKPELFGTDGDLSSIEILNSMFAQNTQNLKLEPYKRQVEFALEELEAFSIDHYETTGRRPTTQEFKQKEREIVRRYNKGLTRFHKSRSEDQKKLNEEFLSSIKGFLSNKKSEDGELNKKQMKQFDKLFDPQVEIEIEKHVEKAVNHLYFGRIQETEDIVSFLTETFGSERVDELRQQGVEFDDELKAQLNREAGAFANDIQRQIIKAMNMLSKNNASIDSWFDDDQKGDSEDNKTDSVIK